MRKDSVTLQYQIYFSTAVLASHASAGKSGFRQKDLKFIIELFSNWMESTLERSTLSVHNIQISRYLNELVETGFAKRLRTSGSPRYLLTRPGILGVLQQIMDRERILPLEQFYFLHYFVHNYGQRIDELVRQEGVQFPSALRVELDALRDPGRLLERQIRFIEKEIEKLNVRIDEGVAAAGLAKTLYAQGRKTSEVVLEIQKNYPYELNNQKPLQELFSEIPEPMRRFELESGALQRALHLWTPLRDFLQHYRRSLQALSALPRKL